ncbi:HlyD family type I secretion periplasmic adaptor subunit [Insolitispirillum peregrinum]
MQLEHSNGTGSAPQVIERGGRQLRYLAQSVLLEEMGVSHLARMVVYIVTGLVAAFIVWSSFTHIQEIASASGSIVPKSSVHTVQHLEGGIVSQILVQERQMVEAGQPLVRLDPAQAAADVEQIKARRAGLQLRAERLRAFASGRAPDFSFVEPRFVHLITDQSAINIANLDRWKTQIEVIKGEIAQKTEEIRSAKDQQDATRRQISLLSEEVQMRKTLFEAGHSSKVAYYDAKRSLAAVESELHRLEGQERTAREAISELDHRLKDLDSTQRQDALNELGTVTAELAQVEESLIRADDRAKRLTIDSPVRGFVQNLQVKTIGGVVPAGGVLMDIVPVDDELLVEARISTRDRGHVHEGQQASIKVTTYDFVRYGAVHGVVTALSATTFVDEKDGQPYYKAIIALDRPWVESQDNRLLPGMTVQADVITGDKTLLQYLLKPIYVSLAHAFHER